jgi:hypothetical protein
MLGRTKYITAELLMPKPGAFEFEMAIEKLKRYKSQDIDHIQAELINKTGSIVVCSETHKLN